MTQPSSLPKKLLWIDCTAGAVAGAAMLILGRWVSELYALPAGLLLFMGTANLLYAAYSFSLAIRPRRPGSLIRLLVFANLAWAAGCLGLVWAFRDSATLFGIGHLVFEAAFVGGLAVLEWRNRDLLLTST